MCRITNIKSFKFPEGKIILKKYRILEQLGEGWEGEVYRVLELSSKIVRAAKFFFPHRNIGNKTAARYAKKLDKLSHCPLTIRYHTQEFLEYKGHKVSCFISEYVEGDLLSEYVKHQPGKRMRYFPAILLLHSLAAGLENMHAAREYHGDMHTDNIIVKRFGLGFDIKLLDMHHWGDSKKDNMEFDICNTIRIFYDIIGGAERYHKHPPEIKEICLGLKKGLILKKFKTAGHLRTYLENIDWYSAI